MRTLRAQSMYKAPCTQPDVAPKTQNQRVSVAVLLPVCLHPFPFRFSR